MDIKKFKDFIIENKYIELAQKHGSFGQYVKKLEQMFINDDEKIERFRQIVGKYLDDSSVDAHVNILNSINTLEEIDQRLLVKELKREFKLTEDLQSQEIDTQQEVESDISEIKDMRLSGKFGFNSFLKVITALNLPNIEADYENCPPDFSIIYSLLNLDKSRLINIMKRFKSLEFATNLIENTNSGRIGLYFGIKFNKQFSLEYGLIIDDKRTVCGDFKLGRNQLRNILNIQSKALGNFKELMANCDLNRMKILMRVKYDLDTFSPGYFHRKSNPSIVGDILTVGYYGVGKWDKGRIDNDDYQRMKSEFNDWILNQKWKKNVTYNVKPGKFWVYFKIKVK